MIDSGIKLNDELLAHMALHHLPSEYDTTKHVIMATAESSNVALPLNTVLSQINELIKDEVVAKSGSALATRLTSHNPYRNSRYERCSNGCHNPKTAHSESECWQLHPHKSPHSSSKLQGPNTQANSSSLASINRLALVALAFQGNGFERPILDSGASQNMFKDRGCFSSYSP